jgi:membrane dipeptidase
VGEGAAIDALALHRDATVVELHNDLILLVDHFDDRRKPEHFREYWLPELRAGGVNVQVLPVSVEERFQSEGALRRCLLLIERIHRIVGEHPDELALCLTGADVDKAIADGKIAFVIAIEGAHLLGQDPALIRTLWRVGVRVLSFTHLGRTFMADGGGLDDTSNSRLTAAGIEVFEEMERLGIVFDLSHLGARGVDHVLELATRPLFATHSGCRAIVDIHRNLTDDQIRRIAEVGGVIGVAAAIPAFIDPADPSVDRVVDHIEHIAALTSFEHVAVGPDFIDDIYETIYDGWVFPNLLDVEPGPGELARPSDLPKLTEAMVRRGIPESDICRVLGENALRILREVMGAPK